MKVPPKALNSFYTQHKNQLKAVLLYGEDPFFVSFQLERFIESCLNVTLSRYTYCYEDDVLKENIDIKAAGVSPGFFDTETPAFCIQNCGHKIVPWVTALTKEEIGQLPLLLTAPYLRKTSKLRTTFENETDLAVLPCYALTLNDWQQLITQKLNKESCTIEHAAQQRLALYFQSIPYLFQSEMEKLATYMGDKNHITLADIESVCVPTTQSNIDHALNLFFDRNAKQFAQIDFPVLFETMPPISLLRMLSNQVIKFITLRECLDCGQTFQQAAYKVRPPILPFQQEKIQQQLRRWPKVKLLQTLAALEKIERAAKSDYEILNTQVPQQLLLCLAR